MSDTASDPFEQMIRDAGENWLIDWHSPKKDALSHLRSLLRDADAQSRQRFGESAPRLTPEDLLREYQRNPHKIRAFLQVLPSVASPDMLVMAWRILQGMEVAALRMEYEAGSRFHLQVRISSPGGQEEYESEDIDDAVVLRHLGILKINAQPLFDGFYALG